MRTEALIKTFTLVFIGFCSVMPACVNPDRVGQQVNEVNLEDDLRTSTRVSYYVHIYRASNYIADNGGPALPDPLPATRAQWEKLRQEHLLWLNDHRDRLAELQDGYPEFVLTHSPRLFGSSD